MSAQPVVPSLNAGANVSVDVDALDCYRDIHGLAPHPDGGADPMWTVGVDRALRLFEESGLSATFFVVGRDLECDTHRHLAERIAEQGHEVANHTYDHPYDLRRHTEVDVAHQLETTNRIIADVTGERPVGFRAPGYNVDADVIALSRRFGHRYDASVFPCVSYWMAKTAVMGWRAVRGDHSRSDQTDPKNLLAPRGPYFPDPLQCWHPAPGTAGYVEIPVAAFAGRTMPVIGTTLHILDAIGWQRVWPVIDRSFPDFFNLEMHAADFVDASDLAGIDDADKLVARQPDLRIEWPRKRRLYGRVLQTLVDHRTVDTLAGATAGIGNGLA